jgi:hypothetical protein
MVGAMSAPLRAQPVSAIPRKDPRGRRCAPSTKPPPSHPQACYQPAASHPHASHEPSSSSPHASLIQHPVWPPPEPLNITLCQSHPGATPKPTGSQPVATRKPPGSHPEATLRLPRGYPEATPRLREGRRNDMTTDDETRGQKLKSGRRRMERRTATNTDSTQRQERSLLEKGLFGGIIRLVLNCAAGRADASCPPPQGAGEQSNVIPSLVSVH